MTGSGVNCPSHLLFINSQYSQAGSLLIHRASARTQSPPPDTDRKCRTSHNCKKNLLFPKKTSQALNAKLKNAITK